MAQPAAQYLNWWIGHISKVVYVLLLLTGRPITN